MAKGILPFLFLIILVSISCSTSGHFTSNPKDKMAHAGTEFVLTKSDSFQIRSWTDVSYTYVDESGNKIWKENRYRGQGIYQRIGDSLALKFTNSDSITVRINYQVNEDLTESFDVSFINELGKQYSSQFQIQDEDKKILRNVYFSREDTYSLDFNKGENPRFLKLTGYGVRTKNPIIDLEDLQPDLNEFKRKTYNGYFPYHTTLNIWFRPTFTGIRYEFKGRRRWLPKKWRFKLLNRLYRDY